MIFKDNPFHHGIDAARLPDSNPKSVEGRKKPSTLSVVPASALLRMGQVMTLGARKYGPFNWRENDVAASVYVDAALRHLMQWWDGESIDAESGVSHLAHAMAGLGILVDAIENGNVVDDRPKLGPASSIIAPAE